ncbi:MAG TPA: dienelactone hydrolase family protein [Caulobacteraceae bacterium]|jgi:carboxymethylenebutenolidase
MADQQITIKTADGDCPAHVLTPSRGEGPWPAVIFYMDALGMRPVLVEMAQRLADAGYVVLAPDLFYRAGPYTLPTPAEVFKGDFRAIIGPLMSTTDNAKAGASDTAAFLAYLDSRADVRGPKIGTVGFCMGGGMALTAAGTYPDRVAAAISFHGGNLASDSPLSPHLLAPKMKAEVYVAGADNDNSYPPEMAQRLEKALSDAGVRHKCEIYAGAHHGWMKPDFPIYDEAAAERGWREMFAVFERNLR